MNDGPVLTDLQEQALDVIRRLAPITADRVGHLLDTTRGQATRALNRLYAEGLIEPVPPPKGQPRQSSRPRWQATQT